jgi:hypothetical protein
MFSPPLLTLSEQEDPVPQKTRRTWKKSADGDRMAALFRSRPNERVSALVLEEGYGLRWRTTVSDLRFAPYHMDIRNELEPYVNSEGRRKVKSFYKFVPG